MQFSPRPIVGHKYCCSYAVDVRILRKVMTLSDGKFEVTDNKGNVIFQVKRALLTLHHRRVLIDASGQPILTLRQQRMTAHCRWQAFRGESSDIRDLVFTAQASSVIQLRTELDVFLANNRNDYVCDFKVQGSWSERPCVIYAGELPHSVAQMQKETSVQSVLPAKDKIVVTVYPNIDLAFIVALIVIFDEINGGD